MLSSSRILSCYFICNILFCSHIFLIPVFSFYVLGRLVMFLIWKSHLMFSSVQFSSVAQSCPTLCDPMNHSTQASLSITNSRSSLRLAFIESVMPSSHLILGRPLLLLPPIPPSIKFSSVQVSRSVVSESLRPHESQHTGLPVHHQLLEFTQTHIHRVRDAIQPSHPGSSPSPPASNPSQHLTLGTSYGVFPLKRFKGEIVAYLWARC